MPVTSFHCEVRKAAYRQTKDGHVLSLVIHPHEVPAKLATDPLGTRYMLALAEIGDDEQPIDSGQTDVQERQLTPAEPAQSGGNEAVVMERPPINPSPPKPRRHWRDMPASARAGMLCADPQFWSYLLRYSGKDIHLTEVVDEHWAADWLRSACRITTRADIERDTKALGIFLAIETEFDAWRGRIANPERTTDT